MTGARCPHCDEAAEIEGSAFQAECPSCLRPFGICPVCASAVRLYDYWRRPGVLPPLPEGRAGRKITFTVEQDGRGARASFDEAGHLVVLFEQGRALSWTACPRGG